MLDFIVVRGVPGQRASAPPRPISRLAPRSHRQGRLERYGSHRCGIAKARDLAA